MIGGVSTRTTVNRIRNARLLWSGGRLPHWEMTSESGARITPVEGGRGTRLVRGRSRGDVFLAQEVAIRPGQWYRVEGIVHGDTAPDSVSGCALMVEPVAGPSRRRDARIECVVTPIAQDSAWLRAYYRSGDRVTRIRVGVVLCGSARACRIEEVRLIPILEPELQSHPLSLPPPDVAVPPPVEVRRALVITDAPDRPLMRFLRAVLGDGAVACVATAAKAIQPSHLRGIDALFLPDADPPQGIRIWRSLLRLAQGRIVVVSLPILAAVAGLRGALRRVDQPDDPIHAAVAHASFVTRSFALRDAFPFAWRGSSPGGFQHRQFRRSAALKAWCDRNGCVPVLTSLCNQDATSDRVVALLKPLDHGAVLAMDVEPIEVEPSSFDEPASAAVLLLNALGRRVSGLGQYIVPHRAEADFRNSLREAAWRFPAVHVHDEDVPIDQVSDQLVTIGEGPSRGAWAADARPVVLVRTGLTSGDLESVYGAWLFFKNLVRMRPYDCPYAQTLRSQYRLAWLPLCAPWEDKLGWRRSDRKRRVDVELGIEDGRLAALIDIVARPRADVSVAAIGPSRLVVRLCHWLPRLHVAFGPGAHLALQARRDAQPATTQAGREWRELRLDLSVRSWTTSPDDAFASTAVTHGSLYSRIEAPAADADFSARSPATTGAVASALEHTIGLIYGLIAVNRGWRPIEFAPFAPVQGGQCLIIPSGDPILEEALVSA